MLKPSFKDFIICHDGWLNRLIHLVGLGIMVWSIWNKNLIGFLLGALIQEAGHLYQYLKTGDKKYSPLHCLKPQIIFVLPLFLGIIIYIIS